MNPETKEDLRRQIIEASAAATEHAARLEAAAGTVAAGDLAAAATALDATATFARLLSRFGRQVGGMLLAESIDPGHDTCQRCNPPCGVMQQCAMCLREMPHDYVHWNGAFEQCGHCARTETDEDTARCETVFLLKGEGPGARIARDSSYDD